MRIARSLTGGALIVAVLAAITLPAAGAPTPDTVRVSFLPNQSNGGLFIAEKEGFFAAERIKITWASFPGGTPQFMPVLALDQLDVGAGALAAAFFNAVTAGLKVRLVADKGHLAGRGTAGSFVVRKDLAGVIRSAADLKGRRVSINVSGALAHYLIAKYLAGGGLTMDQVTLATRPFPASVAALQSGAIDLAVLPAPMDAQAVEIGAGVRIADFADIIPGEPTAFIIMGPNLLETNRALGVRFLVAYLRGLKVYNEGPTARNVATVAEYLKVEPDIVRKGGWIGIHADGRIEVNRLRRYQDWLYEIGMISVRNPIATVVDTSLLGQARNTLGIASR